MTWMSLPTTSYDKYVAPGGSDSANGNSWGTAYATLAKASTSFSSDFGRVWLAPGSHVVTSEITTVFKKIQWIGPPIPGAGFDAPTGAAYITGTANSLDFFFESQPSGTNNTFGGGFRSLVFDMGAVKTSSEAKAALWLKQTNYAVIEDCWAVAPTGSHRNVYLLHPDDLSVGFDGNPDKSWGTFSGNNAQNCGLFLADEGNGELNGWRMRRLYGDTDATNGATIPYINVDEALKGCYVDHVYFRNTATSTPAMIFDERGHDSRNRALNFSGIAFADLRAPYHGLELYDTMSTVTYPGGNAQSDGKIWGDNLVVGYMAVPTYAAPNDWLSRSNGSKTGAAGVLTTGVN